MGKLTKSASVTWQEGMAFEGIGGSGSQVKLGGGMGAAGFSPMELVLVGLAGCTAMDVISILRKKRQEVTGFQVKVTGERAEEHPKVYTRIDIEYIVAGRGVDPKAVARSIELSQRKYCSVSFMLGKTAGIHTAYRIVEAGQADAQDLSRNNFAL